MACVNFKWDLEAWFSRSTSLGSLSARSGVTTQVRKSYYFPVGIILGLLASNSAGAADAPSNYGDVLLALQSAKTVKVVVDLHQCSQLGGSKAGPSVLGGLVINAFNVVPNKGILFSDVHHTLDSQGIPVTAYIRYDLAESGELTLTVTRLSENGTRKEDVYVCPVPGGAKFVW
jgi:hypothetical protein